MKILQGETFSNLFTIVSDDGVTGEVLNPSDTGKMKIMTVGENTETIIDYVDMVQEDPNNGIFKVTLVPDQTLLLDTESGFPEDNYKSMKNYRAIMVFNILTRPSPIIVEDMVSVIGSA